MFLRVLSQRVHRALGKSVAHATELALAGLASWVGFLMAPQLSGQGVELAAVLAGESTLPHVQHMHRKLGLAR